MSVRLTGVGLAYPGAAAALSAVDLDIAAGEHVAVIGPSGAGKSSLLGIMGTALVPSVGDIRVLQQSPGALSPRSLRHLRSTIGMVHQAPPLPPRQRVITAVAAGRLGQWSIPKALRNLVHPVDRQGVAAVLSSLALEDKCFVRCDALSGGQKQRVAIARVLYQMPAMILADEPVSALDPATALSVLQTLGEQARIRRTTFIASLHNVDLALQCFPRLVGLRNGCVQFDLPRERVTPGVLAALYEHRDS